MFDVVSFCQDYNIAFSTSGKNVSDGWVGLPCPFHTDHDFHLGFNLAEGYFSCWKCGHHSIEEVVKTLVGLKDTQHILKDYDSVSVYRRESVVYSKQVKIPNEPLSKVEKDYLTNRGFDWDYLVKKYNIRGGGLAGKYRFRIIIPFYWKKKLISFQGRAVSDEMQPKYLAASPRESLMNIKDIFYNIDNTYPNVVGVVEGAFDVFRLGDGFIASCGMGLTPTQIRILANWPRIVLFFDNSTDAQKRAEKYGTALASLGKVVELIQLKWKNDGGELNESEAHYIRKEVFG